MKLRRARRHDSGARPSQRRGLLLAATLATGLALPVLFGYGQTLDWLAMCVVGGLLASALTIVPYRRWLAGSAARPAEHRAAALFWTAVAFVVLFFFWFGTTLTINTQSWRADPLQHVEGRLLDKQVSKGRYSNTYQADFATARGTVRVIVPRDLWQDLDGRRSFTFVVCPGLLGYPYVVTPLENRPLLDLRRLFGRRAGGLAC